MPTITLPNPKNKKWALAPRGDLVGVLWYVKNVEPRSNYGKLRLSERLQILFDGTDDAGFTTAQYPRAYIRTNADGTDRWWAMVLDTDLGASAMYNTSGTAPNTGWAVDALLNSPHSAKNSMDTFLRVGAYDRLIVGYTGGDLAMLNNSNATTLNISSSTNASPIQITTSANHNLFTGDRVTIAGHTINTAANGTWTITKVDATNFTLDGSTGNGVGGADGTVTIGKWIRKWWTGTLSQTSLDTSHPIVVKRSNKILLIGNANYIHVITPSSDGTITSSSNVSYKRLVFPDQYEVNWIQSRGSRIWIGLNNISGGDAVIAPWNGGEETYEDPLPLYDPVTFAGEFDENGVLYTVNGKGQILAYNGASFQQVDAFPIFYESQRWGPGVGQTPVMLHRNGMCLIDGQLNFFIKGDMESSNTGLLEDMPSGIWVLDKDFGLYCKYTLPQNKSGGTVVDFGAKTLVNVGALVETTLDYGRFLIGAEMYTDNASTRKSAILNSATWNTTSQRGIFCTVQIQASGIIAFWNSLKSKFKELENSTDAIIIKARTEIDHLKSYKRASVTWTATNTFTSTSSNLANAEAGDEIEIYVGKGAGTTAHISSISVLAGTYTVVLDESISNVSGTAQVYLNNFQKLGSITDQATSEKLLQILRQATWVQIKVELRGTETSPEFEQLQIEYQ